MRQRAIVVVVTALVAVAGGATFLSEKAQNTLTTIDTVPTRAQLDNAFDNSPTLALQNLSAIAMDNGTSVGIRLRAIHALAKYCVDPSACVDTDVAHETVTALLLATRSETVGSPLLLLRAAIETLGAMRVRSDVTTTPVSLVSLLDHPSRDIRASTARALQEICSAEAITPLRVHYLHEPTEQVKLAISEALRILSLCAPTP